MRHPARTRPRTLAPTPASRPPPAKAAAPGLGPLALAALALLPGAGCGALIFPERQHEPHSDKLDPNILILDGIGLLFFILPGLVAFGIDFYTGAIYLPEGVEKGEGPFIGDPERDESAEAAPDAEP